ETADGAYTNGGSRGRRRPFKVGDLAGWRGSAGQMGVDERVRHEQGGSERIARGSLPLGGGVLRVHGVRERDARVVYMVPTLVEGGEWRPTGARRVGPGDGRWTRRPVVGAGDGAAGVSLRFGDDPVFNFGPSRQHRDRRAC